MLAYVALGSNLGNRRETLDAAARALHALDVGAGSDASEDARWAASRWHETEPVGGPARQPKFLNGVCRFATRLAPEDLLLRLQELERRAGRDRAGSLRNGPRELDLDLLFYGDATLDLPGLEVPHPRLEERVFVLAPLAELDPERRLAGCGRSVTAQLEHLTARTQAVPKARFAPMARFERPAAARDWARAQSAQGASIGFVPTMGALHEGHLGLVRRAAAENDAVIVSVFVNPLQFDDPSDLSNYPRDFERDAELLESAGCSAAFTGTLPDFFPEARGGEPAPRDPGPAAAGLEGAHRGGHFDGVATIVGRLFEIVRPDRAYFGQKDFQQTLVVRSVAEQLGFPEVVVCPTSRDPDGLARSSRNARLTADERPRALALARALAAAHARWADGERDAERLSASMRAELDGLDVEYAEVRDPERWSPERPQGRLARAQALIAARVGAVRLIDNLRLDGELPEELAAEPRRAADAAPDSGPVAAPAPALASSASEWVQLEAPCKINPFLEVLGRRADGNHEVETTLLALDLVDQLRVRTIAEERIELRVDGPACSADVPRDERNLVWRAAAAARAELGSTRGIELWLHKRVPSQAGLGGGSSNAAAAIRGVELALGRSLPEPAAEALLGGLGADCNFFRKAAITGFACCTGRGEVVRPEPLDDPDWWVALIVPAVAVSTASVFSALAKDLSRTAAVPRVRSKSFRGTEVDVRSRLFNRLERAAYEVAPELKAWRSLFEEIGAQHYRMSGSGSAFYGLFRKRSDAEQLQVRLATAARASELELRAAVGGAAARCQDRGVTAAHCLSAELAR